MNRIELATLGEGGGTPQGYKNTYRFLGIIFVIVFVIGFFLKDHLEPAQAEVDIAPQEGSEIVANESQK